MPIEITRYDSSKKEIWDNFVKTSKNGTFLFMRDYMEYHSDRFVDCSLMFYSKKELLAILPANINNKEKTLTSHRGLTYGGFIMHTDTRFTDIQEMVNLLKMYMANNLNVERLIYKPVPYIYNSYPSEEPLYALFQAGARTTARSISTTIYNHEDIKFSQLRRRCIAKATKAGIECRMSEDYGKFWEILDEILQQRHCSKPVHTLEEIKLLHSRFPENIKLYTANLDREPIAGIVVYETEHVAHFQYIASSDEGCRTGALDLLISYLVNDIYPHKRYIDFGTSTEDNGRILNTGLISQKEGFGGRGVVYDTYELDI
ncbi:MAG: GNAT family N-acetyltransferase [Bacteroidaceae bacterium]|nr:GNAT family N-acetyltransferase [Bacteroidaceae bacterium]